MTEPKSGVTMIPYLLFDQAVEELRSQPCRVFKIHTITDTKFGFFEAIQAALPLGPPIQTLNWDALTDSLWEGIYQLDENWAVIAWKGAPSMKLNDPELYCIALDVLEDVARQLQDEKATLRKTKTLSVLVET